MNTNSTRFRLIYLSLTLAFICHSVCIPTIAQSQSNPSRTQIFTSSRLNLKALLVEPRALSLVVKDRNLGTIQVLLSYKKDSHTAAYVSRKQGIVAEPYHAVLLRGRAFVPVRGDATRAARRKAVRASAIVTSIPGKPDSFKLTFLVGNVNRGTVRFIEISSKLKQGMLLENAKIRGVSSYALYGRSCGSQEQLLSTARSVAGMAAATFRTAPASGDSSGDDPARYPTSSATLRVAELVTDCDSECGSKLGGSVANAAIAGFVNTVNSIYQDQLGVTLDLVRQFRQTSSSVYPPSATDPNQLLELLRSRGSILGASDIKHLVTGKQMNSQVIGLAYVGAVCVDSGYSVSWSQHFNSLLTPIIMAHEIGHNFSAEHTLSGIMQASLGLPAPGEFAMTSIQTITNFITVNGNQCLGTRSGSSESSSDSSSSSSSAGGSSGGSGGDPLTRYSKLTTTYKKGTFNASITFPDGYDRCTVQLIGAADKRALQNQPIILANASQVSVSGLKIAITGLRNVKPGKNKTSTRVFLFPRVTCEIGGNLNGLQKTIQVQGRLREKRLMKTPVAWLESLGSLLRNSNNR